MPIFREPPGKLLHGWDLVDFNGKDGRIHRGIVTDVIKPGIFKRHKELLVDENSSSQIRLKMHRTFCFETNPYVSSRDPGHSSTVQILLQASPPTPWTWWPGKLIMSDRRSFALVEVVNLEGVSARIIVPPKCVRYDHVAESFQRIECPDFVKKSVRVPKTLVLDDQMRCWWERRLPGTKPCSLSGSSLSYLQASSGHEEKKTINITTAMIEEYTRILLMINDGDLADVIRLANEAALKNRYNGPSIHHILPKEIMYKIFRYLYTEQQAKARCVCKQWNSWLQSPASLKELRFDLCGENRYLNENDCLKKYAAHVHGLLAPTSQRVVLTAGNGNVVRHLFQTNAHFSPCLFDQLLGTIDPGYSCSSTFPARHTNCSEWSTTYTLTRGGVRWSFELVVIRIYSCHGPNENGLQPTVFPDDCQAKPGVPRSLRPFKQLSGVGPVESVCQSNLTRFVFTAGTIEARCRHVLTWDIDKGHSGHRIPLNRVQCFEDDHIAQLKMSTDGTVLFAGGSKGIAVLGVCQDAPEVRTILQNPHDPCNYRDYYAARCPMVVSDDGNLCFVVCATGEVLLWDVRTRRIAARFREPSEANLQDDQCIDRSSDGLAVWTSGPDMKVRSWDIRTFTQLHALAITGLAIHAISCCPHNQWIAAGINKKFSYITIDDVNKFRPELYIPLYSAVVEILNVTEPDKYLVETLDNLSEYRSGELVYSPNGDWLIATSETELNVLHHPHGYLAYQEQREYYGGCVISADGKFVAAGTEGGAVVYEVV